MPSNSLCSSIAPMASDFLPLPRANKSLLPSTPWQTTSNNTALNDRNHWRRHPFLPRHRSRHHTTSPPIGDLWHRPTASSHHTAPTSRGRSAHEQCPTVRSCASCLGRHLAHCPHGHHGFGRSTAVCSAFFCRPSAPRTRGWHDGGQHGCDGSGVCTHAPCRHLGTLWHVHRPNRRALRRMGLRHHLEHRLFVGCQCLHPRSHAHRKWGV